MAKLALIKILLCRKSSKTIDNNKEEVINVLVEVIRIEIKDLLAILSNSA